MRLRIAGIGVVLVLAAGLLSACRSNVGVAARVGGHEISENTVSDYVLESGPRTATSASPSATTVSPRPVILNYLVAGELFRQMLADNGGVPSDPQLSALRDRALQVLLGAQAGGSALTASLETLLGNAAIKSSFLPSFARAQELEYVVITRSRIASPAELAAAVEKAHVPVRVNPRYGAWLVDPAKGQVGIDPSGGVPAYLHLQPTAQQTQPVAP